MATKRQTMKKVRELAKKASKSMVEKAEQLYKSGGVDPADYSDDEYRLARILLASAMEDYQPWLCGETDKKVAKNLSHF